MNFSDRIKQLREEKDMTSSELAALFKKSESAIRAWETNRTKPDADTLIKLAEYFECTTDYLLGISEFKNKSEITSINSELDDFSKKINEIPENFKSKYLQAVTHLLSIVPKSTNQTTLTSLNFAELMQLIETISIIQNNLSQVYLLKQKGHLTKSEKTQHFVSQFINKSSAQTFFNQYLTLVDKMVDNLLDIKNENDYMWYMDYTRNTLNIDKLDYDSVDFDEK